MGTKRSRVTSAVAALGACILALGAYAPAMAADPDPGNIAPAKQGSITIYKHKQQTGTITTGAPTDKSDALVGHSDAVADVTFTLFPFTNLPLVNSSDANANWARLAGLKSGQGATNLQGACEGVTNTAGPTLSDANNKAFTFGARTTLTATDANGMTKASNLAVGAYLLCETGAPNNVLAKAAPTVVTIPHPDVVGSGNSQTSQWLYDVTIYPKNSVGGEITKTIKQQDTEGRTVGLGSVVEFPVAVDIPAIADGESFSQFIVVDSDLKSESRWSDEGVKEGSVKIGDTALKSQDYVINDNGNSVYVALTQSGLAKLKQHPGEKLNVIFVGKLNSLGDGVINNKAKYYMSTVPGKTPPSNPPTTPPNTPPTGETTPPPTGTTPAVTTRWGNFKLHKGDSVNNAHLAGAKFKVYNAATPYAETKQQCATDKAANAEAISVKGSDTFTTDASGVATIEGLFVSDSVNPKVNATFRCYVLEEVEAPAGYVLPAQPLTAIAVEVGPRGTDAAAFPQIKNTKTEVPPLPLTGASGVIVLTASGLGLLALGGALVAINRRRRQG